MKKREILTNPLSERRVFFLVAIIYLIPVGMFKYVGSLDGPQHLLTSNIIAGLLSGSDFYGQFFQFNPPVIGNSLGNYILGVLNLILPAWMAEKILLISYLMAFFYGFRYLVVSIKGKADYKLLVIFPFAFHTLFLLGYYNYSIAVAFMFFSLIPDPERPEPEAGYVYHTDPSVYPHVLRSCCCFWNFTPAFGNLPVLQFYLRTDRRE